MQPRLKFQNVDIEDCLRAVMEKNTKYYQSDFEYDKAAFLRAAQSSVPEDRTLLWMSRQAGTWCFKERDIFIRDSEAFHTWQFYRGSNESILAYTVEITGLEKGKIKGNIYPQDYQAMAEHIERAAIPAATVSIRFEGNDNVFQYGFRDYMDRRGQIHSHNKKVDMFRLEVREPDVLRAILQNEYAFRTKFLPGVFEGYLDSLTDAGRESVTHKLNAIARQSAVAPPESKAPKHGRTER